MASDWEIAAGMIKGIKKLERKMEASKYDLAVKCLDAVENIPPAPPWNTGALRNSGAVYIGSRLIATTSGWGQNPHGPAVTRKRTAFRNSKGQFASKMPGGLSRGSVPVDFVPLPISYMSKRSLGSSVVDTITVVYRHPVAALMHEWTGNFSPASPEAGAHYISSKLDNFGARFIEVLKRVFI